MSDSAEDLSSWVGRRIDKYEVVRPIGQGGMGTVFEAVHLAIGKRVAMKFVTQAMAGQRDSVERFLREARAASAVESGHIVEIFDTGEDDEGRPYIVMELLRGESLASCIARLGSLSTEETVRITGQLLRGLVRAHQADIVHRDLKPDNVFLVDRDGEPSLVKLLDFGISKVQHIAGDKLETLTREGAVLGTPHYMSPEQAQGLEVDERTDLWAVGAILFECLTGRLAFTGNTYEQVIVKICAGEPPDIKALSPSVPSELAALVQKSLTQDKAQRAESAAWMLDQLHRIAPEIVPPRADPLLKQTPNPNVGVVGEFDQTVAASSSGALGTAAGVSRLASGTREPSTGRAVTLAGIVLLVAGLGTMASLMFSLSGGESEVPVASAPSPHEPDDKATAPTAPTASSELRAVVAPAASVTTAAIVPQPAIGSSKPVASQPLVTSAIPPKPRPPPVAKEVPGELKLQRD